MPVSISFLTPNSLSCPAAAGEDTLFSAGRKILQPPVRRRDALGRLEDGGEVAGGGKAAARRDVAERQRRRREEAFRLGQAQAADFAAANILGPLLVKFSREIDALVRKKLVISGILAEIYDETLAAFTALGWREAARMSGERMAGQKLDAFWLDLSFVGWWLLGSLSFGALNILFTVPYYGLTLAGLHETLVRGLWLPPEPKTPYDEFEEALRTRI